MGVGGGQDIEQAMGVGGGGGRISSRQWGRWGVGYRAGNGGRWGGRISSRQWGRWGG